MQKPVGLWRVRGGQLPSTEGEADAGSGKLLIPACQWERRAAAYRETVSFRTPAAFLGGGKIR